MHGVSTSIDVGGNSMSKGDGSDSLGITQINISSRTMSSIDDYSRVMLQYTRGQLARLINMDIDRQNSGQSGNSDQSNSSVGNTVRVAVSPSPVPLPRCRSANDAVNRL
jgi:hypothetical protein